MNKEEFIAECKKIDLILTEQDMLKFDKYYNLLKEYNKISNLTRIIDEKDVYLKHYLDSIYLLKSKEIKESESICDFGTGAGFPGIVLAIIFPNKKIDLIESNTKKCNFLKIIKNELYLKNITIYNLRIEELRRKKSESYDVVTCRAVSHLRIITELSIPLLKINGYFIPLKSHVKEEIEETNYTIKKMNSILEKIIEYNLPIENAKRTIIIIKKLKKTEEFLIRPYEKIKKEQLL